MPSANDDKVDVAQTYQEIVKAEKTASELESRLDTLDQRLEELLRYIPSELLDADDETFKETLEDLKAQAKQGKEGRVMNGVDKVKDGAHEIEGNG